ncbi:MAG: hypothetical protein ABIL52_07850 [candidate division WOR-3 bacterium]
MKSLNKLLIFSLIISACAENNPNEPGSNTPVLIDLYHGAVNLDPQSYWYLKFKALEGDSIYFEAIVKVGNDISYAFWCDSINFERWKNNQNAQLRDYQEAITSYSFKASLSEGTYYVVLGNSAMFSSKEYWIRGYIRGLR